MDEEQKLIARALRRDPRVTTLSPWDRGSVGALRPGPRRAFVIVDFHVGIAAAAKRRVPRVMSEGPGARVTRRKVPRTGRGKARLDDVHAEHGQRMRHAQFPTARTRTLRRPLPCPA